MKPGASAIQFRLSKHKRSGGTGSEANTCILDWSNRPESNGRVCGCEQSKSVRKIVGEGDAEAGIGPVKTLLDHESFDEVHLLSDYAPAASKEFAAWLGCKPVLHAVELKNPSHHGEILDTVRPILERLRRKKDDELVFHLSPGTPAMAAIWILLGKSQYPATMYQTYNGTCLKNRDPIRYHDRCVAGLAARTRSLLATLGNANAAGS